MKLSVFLLSPKKKKKVIKNEKNQLKKLVYLKIMVLLKQSEQVLLK